MLRVLVLLRLALLVPVAAWAQQINFQHFTIPDGLPQTQVQAIHQGPLGYIWVGTYGGAGRYNGHEFKVFTTRDGLAANTILAISSTDDGVVWMGTNVGLCWILPLAPRFDCSTAAELSHSAVQKLLPDAGGGMWAGTSAGLVHLSAAPETAVRGTILPGRNVSALAFDARGVLWIGTHAGLYRLDPGDTTARPTVLPGTSGAVLSLHSDDKGLWIGTQKGLYLARDGTVARAPGVPAHLWNENINAIDDDAHGVLWVATNQGVLRYTQEGSELLTEASGLMSNISFALFADREGVVWIGNDNGLTKHAPGPFVGYRRRDGLLHYFVRALNEDAAGNLWLGSREGAQRVPYVDGAWRFDRAETVVSAALLDDPRLYAIDYPAPDEALLATADGVVHWREGSGIVRHYRVEDGLPGNQTRSVLVQDNGPTWIGTSLGVVTLEEGRILPAPHPGLARAAVSRIRKDRLGRIWFGSQSPGLFRLADGHVTALGKAEGLTDNTVWDLAVDAHGGVWAGSNGDGLFHVRADGSIRQYTTADGLVNDFVWQVLVDARGRVWAYTNTGLSRLEDGRFTSFGIDDGLPHLEGSATGALQTHDGTLWFASGDGLARYIPQQEVAAAAAPPVLIERVTVAGAPIPDGARLPHQPGLLDIQYAALSYERPRDIGYRYRLLGADDNWSVSDRYRPLSFANLGAGDYVFEVGARKGSGDWSTEPARFAFRIAPPFWQTRGFWMLSALAAGALVWLALYLTVRRARHRQHELETVVEERTRELKVVNEQLQNAAITDPLTGLFNRRYLVRQVANDVAMTLRMHDRPLLPNRDIMFLMIDIDHFKEINDTHGHAAGDLVLRQFAALVREHIRESDYAVRWGGEEFLVVARNTNAALCAQVAARLHAATTAHRFTLADGSTIAVTCSVGASHFPLFTDLPGASSWERSVEVADTAVYLAKNLGRDGWVSIRFTARQPGRDPAELVHRTRCDLAALVREGAVEVDSSFGVEPEAFAAAGSVPAPAEAR